MLKKIILSALLLLFSITSFSQIKLSGKIIDANNSPIELAEIILFTKDSIPLKSEFSRQDGSFHIEEKAGSFILKIRQIGKTLYNKEQFLNNDIDLGIIKLETINTLKEVVVNPKKRIFERKADRLIFNVENSISASGRNAVDVLKVTPRLQIRKDAVKMVGKDDMLLMIDDRLIQLSGDDLLNYLKTIKADDIKNIEVITSPPAKYDAEGNSGIVNIKLKKAKPNDWNSSIRSSYEQATYAEGSLGETFNYQKNKLSVSSNVNYTTGSGFSENPETIYYPTQTWNRNNGTKSVINSINGKLGTDYKLNQKISFGFQYTGSHNKPNEKNNDVTNLSDVSDNHIKQHLITNLINKKNNQSHALNFHTIFTLDTIGRKLSIDADYFNYKRDNNQLFSTNGYDGGSVVIPDSFVSINNLGNQDIQNYAIRIDMEQPLKWVDLNYGLKATFTKSYNNVLYYNLSSGNPVFDTNISNQFLYNENTNALYFSGNKKINEKWDAKIGMRIENTNTKGKSLTLSENNRISYTKLFPTAYLSYKENDDHIFTLNYGKRISRPRYTMLNPFRTYFNPYSYVTGNPDLEPSYTHNISLEHTYKDNLNSSLYYSYSNNGYSLITIIDPNSIYQIGTLINHYIAHSYGINESYTFTIYKWLESSNSGGLFYKRTISNNLSNNKITEGWGATIANNNTFIFNKSKSFLGNLDLMHSFPNTYVDIKNKAVFYSNISFRYLTVNKQLEFNISIDDIFKTNRQKWTQTSNEIKIYRANFENSQNFSFSMAYKFGNNKLKPKDSKGSNSDEKNRAN